MTKLFKNNKGFTLVEVIVVAVIVLILAAVAIPLYQQYMNDSRQAVVDNAAAALATAAGAALQGGGSITAWPNTENAEVTFKTISDGTGKILIPKGMTATTSDGVVTVRATKSTHSATARFN